MAVSSTAQPQYRSFAVLPKLNKAPPGEQAELFRHKVELCSQIFDFSTEGQRNWKEAKRQTLLEIVEYLKTSGVVVNKAAMAEMVSMAGCNIFRALRTRNKHDLDFSEAEEDASSAEKPSFERGWPHLQLVYESFLRFIMSKDVDAEVAKQFVHQNFIIKLLELFDSEDPRERGYLKQIVHHAYGKFMVHRSVIRQAIHNRFVKVIYDSHTDNGVGELLDILGSIITGFALPLREGHKELLIRTLIPLHKVKSLAAFTEQLSHCMAQFLKKDPRLSYIIITSILRCWPVSIASKQVLFLDELEELLALVKPSEFSKLQDALFSRLAQCITCPHFHVAERALSFWNKKYIVKMFNQNREVLFPIVIGSLHRSEKQHWSTSVRNLCSNVLKILMEADEVLFQELSSQHQVWEEQDESREKTRLEKWALLEKIAMETAAGNTEAAGDLKDRDLDDERG